MEAKEKNVTCEHCGSLVPPSAKCPNCGAAIKPKEQRIEFKTFTVKAERTKDAIRVLGQCGFTERTPIVRERLGNNIDLRMERNLDMPNYHAVAKLTEEVVAEFAPPYPRKRFITPMVFFIILGIIALILLYVAFIVNLSGTMSGDPMAMDITGGVASGFLVVGLVFLAPSLLCMIFMIRNIVKFTTGKKAYEESLKNMYTKADLAEKMMRGTE